jgi:hypothetical protein
VALDPNPRIYYQSCHSGDDFQQPLEHAKAVLAYIFTGKHMPEINLFFFLYNVYDFKFVFVKLNNK